MYINRAGGMHTLSKKIYFCNLALLISFSSMIVSGGRDGLIGLWDTQELRLIKLIDYKDKNLVFQVLKLILKMAVGRF